MSSSASEPSFTLEILEIFVPLEWAYTANLAKPGAESFDFNSSTSQFLHADQLIDLGRQCDAADNDSTIKQYTLKSLDGQVQKLPLPSLNTSQGRPGTWPLAYRIAYRNVFQLCLDLKSPFYQGPRIRSAVYIAAEGQRPVVSEPSPDSLGPQLTEWNKQWHTSQIKKTITEFLETNVSRMRRVNKVIGLGLGRLCTENSGDPDGEVSYFQHLTTQHIAQVLARVQNNTDIASYVQDPGYTTTSKALTARHFPEFAIIDDPAAFCLMDKHTIVVQCNMPFGASEVSLAIAGDDGLAGIICPPITQDHQTALVGRQLVKNEQWRDKDMWYGLRWLCSTKKWEWREWCAEQMLSGAEPWFGWDDEGNSGSVFYVRVYDTGEEKGE
ncbi:hypothetical protein FB567DRAFT_594273 [Paraphoma chrysanthemicola]|uniref:SRR1-like domain-containing protein n=1 Tax=Paraphoma chrysanthemicola TaxID=798071 RepID=A0A8K0R4G2_9PLEO|nr:hypothetical protein FB567DRAFT_594273 [Paraphoma chrysanthemicola]